MAELSVFKSAFAYDEKPDYSLQIAQQSGINALCLLTHDLDPTIGSIGRASTIALVRIGLTRRGGSRTTTRGSISTHFSPANAESTERKHGTEASCFASQDAKVFV
jgi:hypothetical protein